MATSCITLINNTTDPTLQCAKTAWGIDDTDNGLFDPSFADNVNSGIVFASSDGTGIPSFPSNIPELSSSSSLSFDDTTITSSMSGTVSLGPSAAIFQDSFFETASKINFSGSCGNSCSSFPVDVTITHDFSINDPGNPISGSTFMGSTTVINDGTSDIYSVDGSAIQSGNTTSFGGSYDGIASSTPTGPGSANITSTKNTTFSAAAGMNYSLISTVIGSVSHSECTVNCGTGTYDVDSANTFTLVITSSDPNVRFSVSAVPEPSSALFLCIVGLGMAWRSWISCLHSNEPHA